MFSHRSSFAGPGKNDLNGAIGFPWMKNCFWLCHFIHRFVPELTVWDLYTISKETSVESNWVKRLEFGCQRQRVVSGRLEFSGKTGDLMTSLRHHYLCCSVRKRVALWHASEPFQKRWNNDFAFQVRNGIQFSNLFKQSIGAGKDIIQGQSLCPLPQWDNIVFNIMKRRGLHWKRLSCIHYAAWKNVSMVFNHTCKCVIVSSRIRDGLDVGFLSWGNSFSLFAKNMED